MPGRAGGSFRQPATREGSNLNVNSNHYERAEKPTLYFIGVTTGKSSIMTVFPAWARYLGLGDCAIKGLDFAPHDEPRKYREAVSFIKSDPLARGALITTHKLDLLKACRDQFDHLDEYAALTSEISCISKRDGQLAGHAKDLITAGLALESYLPERHWEKTGAEAFVLGAGGAAIAITWYLMQPKHGPNRPSKIIVANRTPGRLDEMKELHRRIGCDLPIEYHHTPAPPNSDDILKRLRPASLVINATGLGKDAPGSPLTGGAPFPQDGLAWDFNYRGDLLFLKQARAQQSRRDLVIQDGWVYFLHGWTRVIAEVFHIDIPVSGPKFAELSRIAASTRN
jgi:shikimate 5-dehydrogenase